MKQDELNLTPESIEALMRKSNPDEIDEILLSLLNVLSNGDNNTLDQAEVQELMIYMEDNLPEYLV